MVMEIIFRAVMTIVVENEDRHNWIHKNQRLISICF